MTKKIKVTLDARISTYAWVRRDTNMTIVAGLPSERAAYKWLSEHPECFEHPSDMTMTTKHTPGPWSVDPVWSLIMGPSGEEVAAVHAAQPPSDYKRANKATAESNARLIASAPELLEHLANLHGMLTQGGKSYMGADKTAALLRQAGGL